MYRIARTTTLLALLAVIFTLPALAQRENIKQVSTASINNTEERLVVRVVDLLLDEKIARIADESRSVAIKVKINAQLPEGTICDELLDELLTFNNKSLASKKITATTLPSLSVFKPGQLIEEFIFYNVNLAKGEALDKITFSIRLNVKKGRQTLTQSAQLEKIIAE